MTVEEQANPIPTVFSAQETSPSMRLARTALLVVLVALLGGLLAKTVSSAVTSATMLEYPFQFDESEGMIVAETMLLDRGVNIYDKPTPDLFIAAPYPPLYYLLDWPFQHLLGADPTFKVGRSLSILATLMSGLAIFGITVALTGDKLAGGIAAALWWSLALVTFWGSLVKPDMLALALGLGGLWWLLARPPRQVWCALPFFLGAFFTKQTAIAAGVAGVVWLLATRTRTGLAFGASYTAGALVPTLILNWATNGGYFYHMFTIHDLPWFSGRFVDYATGLLATYWAFLIPGIVAILISGLLWLGWRTGRHPQLLCNQGGLLVFFYLAMSVVAATGAGTLGGNHNHLLELTAASCVGLGLGVFFARRARVWQVRAALALLGLVALAQVSSLFSTPPWLKNEFSVLSADKREGMQNVFQYVTNNGGPAYSDNVGLMLSTHKRLWTTDPFTQTHATFYHRWDQSKLVDAIQRKLFSQIVLRIDVAAPNAGAGDVSHDILQAVRDNYKLDQRNVENIYVPRGQ